MTVLAGGGSCHFSIFAVMSVRNAWPCEPEGSCPYASTRASSVHLAATSRPALLRSEGGVAWMMEHCEIKPCSVGKVAVRMSTQHMG